MSGSLGLIAVLAIWLVITAALFGGLALLVRSWECAKKHSEDW